MWIQFVDTPYAVTYSASGEAYVQWPGGSNGLSLVGYAQVSVEVAGTANTRSFDVLMGKISGATLASRVATDQPADMKIHTYPVVGPEIGLVLRGTPNTTDHVQLWVYLGQTAALGGLVSVRVDSTPGSTAFVRVTDFGATGDGVTDDSTAIQAAIDASDSVFFPLPSVHYRVAQSLQLRNDLTLWAEAMWRGVRQGSTGSFLLVADAGMPVFKTGVYPGGSGGQNRNISLLGLSARSSGAAVLELHTATNFTVERCSFASYAFADATRGAVDIRFSYRGTIRRSNIGASGGAWAISAFDNCNGLVVESSVIIGGNGGGAFDLGQSQSVAFRNNVMEVSKAGVRVGSTAVAGGGNCNGLDVSGNYFEQVREPISLGVGFTVRAATVQNNFISNTALVGDVSPYTFELGRCEACMISNNEVNRASMGTEPLFSFVSAASAPFSFVGGSIVGNRYTGGTGPWKSESGPFRPLASFLFGKNRLQPAVDGPISGSRQYESLAISAASGTTIHAIASATTGGGVIDSIEVFDKNGSSDSTVQLGSAINISEIVSFDPQTLTYSYGAASVAPSAMIYWRPNHDLLLRVLPSSGTGTYRLRVRFRGM